MVDAPFPLEFPNQTDYGNRCPVRYILYVRTDVDLLWLCDREGTPELYAGGSPERGVLRPPREPDFQRAKVQAKHFGG